MSSARIDCTRGGSARITHRESSGWTRLGERDSAAAGAAWTRSRDIEPRAGERSSACVCTGARTRTRSAHIADNDDIALWRIDL